MTMSHSLGLFNKPESTITSTALADREASLYQEQTESLDSNIQIPITELVDVVIAPSPMDTVNSNSWNATTICISITLFIIAGILEVGGGYLVWIGIRQRIRPEICISMGFVVLMAYGLVPTLQPVDSFGRTFAVYGGFFIVLSYIWGAVVDGMVLDKGDYIGGAIALVGVSIAWFWPR